VCVLNNLVMISKELRKKFSTKRTYDRELALIFEMPAVKLKISFIKYD